MPTLSIGDPMPRFPELPATDFKAYGGASFDHCPALVVAFSCNHCPHSQAVEERINSICRDYRHRGVALVAINSNDESASPEDDYEQMVMRARTHEYAYPYLRDADQEVANSFGATHTPEFFLFDRDRRLRFHGGLDDNWQDGSHVTRQFLREAIDALLEGREVTEAETALEGCSIKWYSPAGER
jgi:peroxiredoxin